MIFGVSSVELEGSNDHVFEVLIVINVSTNVVVVFNEFVKSDILVSVATSLQYISFRLFNLSLLLSCGELRRFQGILPRPHLHFSFQI